MSHAKLHALHIWRCYLEGTPELFVLMTDRELNSFFQSKAVLSYRQAR